MFWPEFDKTNSGKKVLTFDDALKVNTRKRNNSNNLNFMIPFRPILDKEIIQIISKYRSIERLKF